jgi:ATP-dependent protease ClpP protease subunit
MANTEDTKEKSKEDAKPVKAADAIKEYGSATIPQTADEPIYIINIIGEIEGHIMLPPQSKATKYEHIIPQLESIEQSKTIKGVVLVLHTMGGDVEAGLAISEMIRGISKPTVSLVLGGGHSIGIPLAVSSNYSFITPTSTMTVHPIRMTGLVIGVYQTFEYLQKMQERLTKFVCDNSKITKEEFEKLMLNKNELTTDIGTILIGKQAVDIGLIDEMGGMEDAMRKINEMIANT